MKWKRSTSKQKNDSTDNSRLKWLLFLFVFIFLIIILKLFFWQIWDRERLVASASSQHWFSLNLPAPRGNILTKDGFVLVENKPAYNLILDRSQLEIDEKKVVDDLLAIMVEEDKLASESARLERLLSNRELIWIKLFTKLSEEKKALMGHHNGLVWQPDTLRTYSEASTAAHLTGFVANNSAGDSQGYFGLEGFYDRELKGRIGKSLLEVDAMGNPILAGERFEESAYPGRGLILHLDRTAQFLAEKKLETALEKYGAISGTVTIMDPKTGGIIAMAGLPDYDPTKIDEFSVENYPNPVVNQSFEPGSTFKVLIMGAAVNEGLVDMETICPCKGPVSVPPYTVSTWDGKYYPDSGIKEIIQHSDNVGMVFVSKLFEPEVLIDYVRAFGFGELTGIDLQEEDSPGLRDEWREIDLATVSFGQGIAATPLQMTSAAAALANGGWLMEPQVVDRIVIQGREGMAGEVEEIDIEPKRVRRVISNEASKLVTEIMVNAVKEGEAKWTSAKGYRIAGKTGTAQIPVDGHYDSEKTIASFVGYAPADDPKFVMLVTLREPKTSPWGSETAAPLWFDIARELFLHYGIAPSEE